jgi:hypothetical protein
MAALWACFRHDLTVSIDDLDLLMRMDAADRVDAPVDRRIASSSGTHRARQWLSKFTA